MEVGGQLYGLRFAPPPQKKKALLPLLEHAGWAPEPI
jgi:hypothetical protein